MELVFADEPLDISEVEDVSSIVKRFVTGMSVGCTDMFTVVQVFVWD